MSNFNAQLSSGDLGMAQAIARAVAERHGGLPGVQAMALHHEQGEHMLAKASWMHLLHIQRLHAEAVRKSCLQVVRWHATYWMRRPPLQQRP